MMMRPNTEIKVVKKPVFFDRIHPLKARHMVREKIPNKRSMDNVLCLEPTKFDKFSDSEI